MFANEIDGEVSPDDHTPTFMLKNVMHKFSDIKNGFDSDNVSQLINLQISSENGGKKSDMLATIIEQDTDEEITHRTKFSEVSDDSYTFRIDERESNIYTSNMQSMKDREAIIKNPFKKDMSAPLPEITEQDEVPDEQEIARFNSLEISSLIDSSRKLEISGTRGSTCYCCCSIRS